METDIVAAEALDHHAHVFHRTDGSVQGARYVPNYDASLDHWLAMLDAKGLTGGTLVQPSFLGANNTRLLKSISEARGQGYAVEGAAVVSTKIQQADLETLIKQGVVALRLNLVERPLPNFENIEWSRFFELVTSMKLTIEIHLEAQRMLPVLEIIQKTGVFLTLDHYALVDSVRQLENLLRSVDTANLSIKRSAPYRLPATNLADRKSLVRDLDACLSYSLSTERILWGSDWPHTRFENSQSDQHNFA